MQVNRKTDEPPTPEHQRETLATFLHGLIQAEPTVPVTRERLLIMLEAFDRQATPVLIRKTPGLPEWQVKLRGDPSSRTSYCSSWQDAIDEARHVYPGRRVIYAGKVVE